MWKRSKDSPSFPSSECDHHATERLRLGDREYLIRLPCTQGQRKPASVSPLLIALHCFGCSAGFEVSKFKVAADLFGFAICAPIGIDNSFNAPSCCGNQQVNDTGFIDALVDHVRHTHPVSPDLLFGTGFSNGGFLASHLASVGQLGGRRQRR